MSSLLIVIPCARASLGPPFEIQLHDRDRKDGICENPYGVAKLDLYPLFLHNLMEREFEVHVNPSTSHSDRWITPAAQPVQLLKPVIPSAVFEKKPAKRTDEKSQASSLKSTKDKTKPNIAPPLPRVDPLPAGSYQGNLEAAIVRYLRRANSRMKTGRIHVHG